MRRWRVGVIFRAKVPQVDVGCRSAAFGARVVAGVELATGRIVMNLLVVGDVATERSAFFVDALIEARDRREARLLLEVVDLTDELPTEQEQVPEMPVDAGGGELFDGDQARNEWLELWEQPLSVGEIRLVDLPGVRPFTHLAHGTHSEGLFYAGRGPTWSNLTTQKIIKELLCSRARVNVRDLHSGLGRMATGNCW